MSTTESHPSLTLEPHGITASLELRNVGQTTTTPLVLRVESGPDRGTSIGIGDRPLVLGSSRRADLVLRDGTVSRLHAEIVPTFELPLLVDLGSRNGTCVGDQRVERAPLLPGSVVRLGRTTLVVSSCGEPHESCSTSIEGLVAESEAMKHVVRTVLRAAPLDATVLVDGESGTGKEGVARALHRLGPRPSGPLVTVDCGALPLHLVEAELFGCERGAFTGADRAREGAFERADGGTLFLDEIGELPLDVQPKLLRALESREIRRIGAAKSRRVTFRLVSATNRDLAHEVDEGRFRADLFHRLAVLRVTMPPLRERPEDVEAIARRFLAELGGARSISEAAMSRLRSHPWPGNVRELLNVLRAATLFAQNAMLDLPDLPSRLAPYHAFEEPRADGRTASDLPFKEARELVLDSFEADYLAKVLRRTGGNVSEAARITGLHRKTVERMARRLGLDVVSLRRES